MLMYDSFNIRKFPITCFCYTETHPSTPSLKSNNPLYSSPILRILYPLELKLFVEMGKLFIASGKVFIVLQYKSSLVNG